MLLLDVAVCRAAFGIVLLELLTGFSPANTIELYSNQDQDLFSDTGTFTDPSAGRWPPEVVRDLSQAAKQCLKLYAKRRATVREVLPTMEALEARAAAGC